MTLQQLLLEFKARTKMNNEAIASTLGVSKSTVGRWINGDTKNLKKETLAKLSNLLNIDVNEVMAKNSFHHLKPILGKVKAGYDLFAEENLEGYIEVSDHDNKRGDYFLRVVGNSMELAKIHDNDLIYVKQCQDVSNKTIAVIMIQDEVTVKRVIKKEGLLILEAANPAVENRYYSAKEVEELPVRIIGKVLYSITEIK